MPTVETPEQVEAFSPRVPPAPTAEPSLSDVAGRALEDVREKQTGLTKRMREQAAAPRPGLAAVGEAGEAVTRVGAERPAPLVTSLPPSRKLTDFLAPIEGESPMTSITKFISGIGVFATGMAGSLKGDARAGLAAPPR